MALKSGLSKRILLTIWELPQTVLARIIIVFLNSRIIKCQYYKNAIIFFIKDFRGGISLGRYIILNDRYSGDESSIKHEYGHSIQSLYLGWFYLLVVGLPSIIRVVIWRCFRLKIADYYKGYPENWANKLGFGEKEYRGSLMD